MRILTVWFVMILILHINCDQIAACRQLETLTEAQLWQIVQFGEFDRYFILVGGCLSVFGLFLTLLSWILYQSFSPPSDLMFLIVIAELVQNSSLVAAAAYLTDHVEDTAAPPNFHQSCIAIGFFNVTGYVMSMYYNILFCTVLAYSIRNTLKGSFFNQVRYHIASFFVIAILIMVTLLTENIGIGISGACGFRAANRESLVRLTFQLMVCGLAIFNMMKFKKKIPKNSYFQKQAIFGYYYYYIALFALSQILVTICFFIGNISCRENLPYTSDIIRISFTVGNCLTLILSYVLIILRFSHPILRLKIKRLLLRKQTRLAQESGFNAVQMQQVCDFNIEKMLEEQDSHRNHEYSLTKNMSDILPTINDEDNSWLGCLLQSIKGSQILSFLGGILIAYQQSKQCMEKQRGEQSEVLLLPQDVKFMSEGEIKKWKGMTAYNFKRFYRVSLSEDIIDDFINQYISFRSSLIVKKKLDGLRTLNYQMTQYFPEASYLLLQKQKQISIPFSFDIQNNISHVKKESYTNGGKSGEFFYATFDHKFVFKTIQVHECQSYLERVMDFYHYFTVNPDSLIVKILGMFKFSREDIKDKPVYLILMKNLSQDSKDKNFRVYDIKGSEYNRSTMNEKKIKYSDEDRLRTLTLKDQDFLKLQGKVQIQPSAAENLKAMLKKDIEFLGRMGVMDYSLLIIRKRGSHYSEGLSEIPSTLTSGEVYAFGIIDYLQSWNFKRKAERLLKTIATDKEVTAQAPIKYAERLSNFIDQII